MQSNHLPRRDFLAYGSASLAGLMVLRSSLARAARARKFGPELPKDWKERSRQARFLQYRGFSTDHIRAVLEGVPDDESGADPSGEPDPT